MATFMSSDGTTPLSGLISHTRKCRDLPFLLLFIAFSIAFIVNSSFAFTRGNPLRLTYGLDYKGNSCGDRHASPNLYQLDLTYWMNPNQVYLTGLKGSRVHLDDTRTICLLDCPSPSEDGLNWVCDYPQGDIRLKMDDWIDRNYDYYEFLTPEMRNSSLQLQGPCYPVIFPSVNVHWRCQMIPRPSNVSMRHWLQMGGLNINSDVVIEETIRKSINARSSVVKRYVADIGKSWPVIIVCGAILPLFISIVWLLLIRHLVIAMPWITVVVFNLLIITVTFFNYLKAGWIGHSEISPIIGDHDPYYNFSGRELNHLRAVAVLMTFVMAIAILTSIAIARRILLATSVLKVAAKVIDEVQALIIFPIAPFFILTIFYILWISTALHLFSSGETVQNTCNSSCCAYDLERKKVSCDNCCGYSVVYSPHLAVSVFFHLFALYWGTLFVLAASSTVIAGASASYYWARDEAAAGAGRFFLPVFASLQRLTRYSLGSVAVGSLIASFVESVRFILDGARRRLKVEDSEGGLIRRVSGTSLAAIEWILKSVNKHAYIIIAVKGVGFFKASAMATELIMNNILRIGKVNVVGDFVLILGKLCVSLFSAVFAFVMLDTHRYNSSHAKISSPMFPVLVCWGVGYVVASLFFGVVQISLDTTILSYCQDSDENEGSAQFAPPLLMETLSERSEVEGLSH